MNRFRLKSGSFEIEIETDQPQSPQEMAQAAISVVKAAPVNTSIIEVVKELPALPESEQLASLGNGKEDQESSVDTTSRVRKRNTTTANGPSASEKIGDQINAGKFETPVGAKEVGIMLRKTAFNFDRTTIAHSLADLVRKNKLERVGDKPPFKYVRYGVKVQETDPKPSGSGSTNQESLPVILNAQISQ